MVSDDSSNNPPPSDTSAASSGNGNERASIQQRLEGKPLLIYGTLLGGALALLLLLMVVWLSTRNDGSKVKLCLDTTVADAQTAILDGSVRRVDVLLDDETPVEGLTAIQLELEGGECRKLPEGADNRDQLLQVLGLVELYNQQGEGNIRVEYQRESVPPNLLVTSTPIPTLTSIPPTRVASPVTGTPKPIEPSPTPAPSETPLPTATVTTLPTRTPTEPPATIPATQPAKPSTTATA